MMDVDFSNEDYKELNPHGNLIYCDPPYKNTIQPYGLLHFDTDKFWDVMRIWSKDNDVFISEYEAPYDFKCVLEIPTKTIIRDSDDKPSYRIEKLFTYDS